MLDLISISEPKKLDSSGKRVVDTTKDPQVDFYDTLNNIKAAIGSTQERVGLAEKNLMKITNYYSQQMHN